jgi:hypothetical protein
MKFETLMLRGLFVACLALCALILGAMLTDRRPAMTLAASAALIEAPSVCALPADGVVCPRRPG